MVGSHSSIEVTKQVESFSAGDSGYCFIQCLVELVFLLWGGAESWSIHADDICWARGCWQAEWKYPLCSWWWRFNEGDERVLDSEADTVLPWFIWRLPLPKEGVACFLMLPLSASRVSCRQATSTFSRESSLSITAVLRALSTCCRSAVNPGHKVLTFQLAKRRAGVFFLRVFFPGAEDVACLLR